MGKVLGVIYSESEDILGIWEMGEMVAMGELGKNWKKLGGWGDGRNMLSWEIWGVLEVVIIWLIICTQKTA